MNSSRIQRRAQSLITFLLVGCGALTSVSVPVTRPAEVNLKDFDKIAIGEITGSESGVTSAHRKRNRALCEVGKRKPREAASSPVN